MIEDCRTGIHKHAWVRPEPKRTPKFGEWNRRHFTKIWFFENLYANFQILVCLCDRRPCKETKKKNAGDVETTCFAVQLEAFQRIAYKHQYETRTSFMVHTLTIKIWISKKLHKFPRQRGERFPFFSHTSSTCSVTKYNISCRISEVMSANWEKRLFHGCGHAVSERENACGYGSRCPHWSSQLRRAPPFWQLSLPCNPP